MKSICISIIFILIAIPTFSQVAVVSSGSISSSAAAVLPTNIVVVPAVTSGSDIMIVVENPPKGTYILELVEPPGQVIKLKTVTNTTTVLTQVEDLDTENVDPGSYFVIFHSGETTITKPVYIISQ